MRPASFCVVMLAYACTCQDTTCKVKEDYTMKKIDQVMIRLSLVVIGAIIVGVSIMMLIAAWR